MDPEEYNDFIAPLQRNAQLQQGLQTTKHLRKIAESNAEAEAAEKTVPQCPFCGGRVVAGFAKCKNCASDLIWYRGLLGKPGDEINLKNRAMLLETHKEKERQAAVRDNPNSILTYIIATIAIAALVAYIIFLFLYS